MFLLATKTIQLLIIGGVILLFIFSFVLNKRTKAPDGVEIPDDCHACFSTSCAVKSDKEKIKAEMRAAINNCEEINEKK